MERIDPRRLKPSKARVKREAAHQIQSGLDDLFFGEPPSNDCACCTDDVLYFNGYWAEYVRERAQSQ